jgi:hypothetical protein
VDRLICARHEPLRAAQSRAHLGLPEQHAVLVLGDDLLAPAMASWRSAMISWRSESVATDWRSAASSRFNSASRCS